MRFNGAEYNNIELGIHLVQYCCTLLHKTSYWSRSSAVIEYYYWRSWREHPETLENHYNTINYYWRSWREHPEILENYYNTINYYRRPWREHPETLENYYNAINYYWRLWREHPEILENYYNTINYYWRSWREHPETLENYYNTINYYRNILAIEIFMKKKLNSYEQQLHQYQQNDQPSHPKKTTTYDIGNVGLAAISLSSTATSSNHNTLYSGFSVLIGYSIAREQNRSQRFHSHKAM